jgi:superfamily II DNA or RNA helicase
VSAAAAAVEAVLTEGTDIPMLKSVFLTRQTTSQILMRQMVGRALRGPQGRGRMRRQGE